VVFQAWHLAAGYGVDLLVGDPKWLPHPVRFIGYLVSWSEKAYYDATASPVQQRIAGCAFWLLVMVGVCGGTAFVIGFPMLLHRRLGDLVMVLLAFSALATRSLHRESVPVIEALRKGDLNLARKRLSGLVSRDTEGLDEQGVLRATLETVAENVSDGIIAPLFYLGLAGPFGAMLYKAANTMDSMVGYRNERYRYFGWWAARMDDVANWLPARLSGLLLVGAAALLKLDHRSSWRIMRRDARNSTSPNAGFPEAAAAGALNIQLGGPTPYFGQMLAKPTIGDPRQPLELETYDVLIKLMYAASFLGFCLCLGVRALMVAAR
jgi:adenosylcobinamide-phosphate synthase